MKKIEELIEKLEDDNNWWVSAEAVNDYQLFSAILKNYNRIKRDYNKWRIADADAITYEERGVEEAENHFVQSINEIYDNLIFMKKMILNRK